MFTEEEIINYLKSLKQLIDIQNEKINLLNEHIKILEEHIRKSDHFTLGFYGEFSREQVKLIKLDKEIDDLTTEMAIKKFKK
jgi:hypothetical protein